MHQDRRFSLVKDKALAIMSQAYDPFHDDAHALAVEQTAMLIYQDAARTLRKQADIHRIRLLALLHDTSRKIIGVNLFLEPLMGGYISGAIGYNLMRESGYPHEESAYIRGVIRNHESFLGLWKYPMDANGKIFADADCIEAYSAKRLQRALVHFENKEFSNLLLNVYVAALTMMHRFARPECFLDISLRLKKNYIEELREFLRQKQSEFRSLLYRRIFLLLYSLDFLKA